MRKLAHWISIVLLFAPTVVYAGGPTDRYEIIQEERIAYVWVVGAWNFESCRILTDEIENVPQYDDISALCGPGTISLIDSGSASLYYLGEYHYREDVKTPLPEIVIRSDIAGDSVVVQSFDPLSGESIVKVDATINGSPAVCDQHNGEKTPDGLICTFPFYNPPVLFTAIATSTNGDRSKNIELRIGNRTSGDSPFLESENKYFVIGDNAYTQYNPFMDIPRVWGTVPGTEIAPNWIKNKSPGDLLTAHYYYYLAGQILLETISAGRNCPNRGLSSKIPGYATNCGVVSVFDQVIEYQNAYNEEISVASGKTGVPSALIKRVIAVESQFYPGALGNSGEKGLYQFTRDGADTLFRWNGPFYLELCAEYWDNCKNIGYDNLDRWQRDVLANHVLADPNNIYYLGSALKANAFQIKKILSEYGKIEIPGETISYADLWKITILNYHAGPTITSAVLYNIVELDLPVEWDSFATVLNDLQPSALRYVNRVVRGN